jgi:hypothetical protein
VPCGTDVITPTYACGIRASTSFACQQHLVRVVIMLTTIA